MVTKPHGVYATPDIARSLDVLTPLTTEKVDFFGYNKFYLRTYESDK